MTRCLTFSSPVRHLWGLFLGLFVFTFTPLLHGVEDDRASRTVILNEMAVKNLGLQTVEAEETTFDETVFALGRIHAFPGKLVTVSSRIPGRALEIYVEPDQLVKKGDNVLKLESRQPGDPPPSLMLVAPITGFVSALNITPGQPVGLEDKLMEIVDLTEVHALAAVPEHLVGKLAVGQRCAIRVPAYPDQVFEAQLEHLGVHAEVETGTLEAVFHMANDDLLLRPGMRAEFSIVVSSREGVLSIPRECVQGDAANRFVYIADYELKNAFVKVPVELGAQNERSVEVLRGLLPGDEVVTKGAYSLAFSGRGSISLKEAMDAAHGHPHNEDGSEMTTEQVAAAQGGSATTQAGGSEWNWLTNFFAGATGVLAAMLALSVWMNRRPTPQ